ncbi:MAG TPA: hypothetical protein VE644_13720 [Gaiellaceae bacterium]|nr:hypothetical protein [Gaiellaceae bacterium]
MRTRLKLRGAAAALALTGLSALVALGAATSGRAATAGEDLSGDCPRVLAVEDVEIGMTGTGLSVTRGRDPDVFDVEVLGVLHDAIGPGRDMIVVDLSGPVIDAAGGLWFGASGSPVYVADPVTTEQKLIGAVAFGLAGGGSTLAGLTPAEDMVDLVDPGTGGSGLALEREGVRLPRALALRAAASAGISVAQISSFVRLKTPLSVSGLNDRGLRRLQKAVDRQNLPFVPFAGSAVSADSSGPPAELGPGDSFAAAISLGDVTAAGIGTTTFVCHGQAVGFGHPFNFSGDTTLAARAADTITIVKDPIFGSYKLANVAENAGTVVQDRLAGILAELGDGPSTTPVTSVVTDLDRGRTRSGESRGVLPEFTPFLAFSHLLVNVDVTIDRIGPGNALMSYRITGTRDGGATWQLRRSNRFASEFDISFDSVWEPTLNAELLQGFDGEEIAITGIEVSRLDVAKRYEAYRLLRVLVWNGRRFVAKDVVRARRGQAIRLRAVLGATHGPGTTKVDLRLRVPRTARRDGFIEVGGGGSTFPEIPCFFEGEECGEEAGALTFDGLLRTLRRQPRNDALIGSLRLGDRSRSRARDTELLDAVVTGSRFIGFQLIRR